MSDHNNIYSIMGKLNALTPKQEPVAQPKKIYESVEAKGSVLVGVKSIQTKLQEQYEKSKQLDESEMISENWKAILGAIVGGAAGLTVSGGNPLIGAAGAYGGYKIGDQGLDQDAEYKKAQKLKQQELKKQQSTLKEGAGAKFLLYAKGPNGEMVYATCEDMNQCNTLKGILTGGSEEPKIFNLTDPKIVKWLADRVKSPETASAMVTLPQIAADVNGHLHVKPLGPVLATVSKTAPAQAATPLNAVAEEVCDECGMYEGECGCDHEHMEESRETLKTKSGTIYKGGKYGTEYDAGEEGGKKKSKATDGEKKGRGRPKKEEPAKYTGPKGDIFGRTTGDAPKGKKGTVIKGKGNQDTVDESAPKGWEGTVKAMKKHKEIDNPWALTHYMKKKGYKSHVKEGTLTVGTALLESVNFQKMVEEANMTVEEMLECINQDIQAYKATGDMTERLRDFMHLHNHMKKMQEASSLEPQKPTGQDILPQQGMLGKIGSKVKKALTGPDDDELLAQLQQQEQPQRSMQDLDELAQLAGIADEGNAFTGKLHDTPHGDEFELDGETYTDTSNLDETKKINLSDIARLSGIFQEGKDYGDVSFNEPPHYDNSPDEQVMGVEVQTQGGDGEVAGGEKEMNASKPTWKNADNPLGESKELMKPAAEFNYVKEMGRDLMKAYQGIKTK